MMLSEMRILDLRARHFLLLGVAILVFLLASPLWAQISNAPPPPPVTPPTTPGTTQLITVSGLSAESMLVRIATQIPNLMRLVTAIAYVMGMAFIIFGVIKLKHLGESRTMMSREHHLMGPLIWIMVGVSLLYIPSAVQVGMSTFWTSPNPYGYVIPSNSYGDFLKVVYLIIQFVGTVAFIRGLVILSHIGQGGGQQSPLAKGILHIIGGIFCINIYQFVQVIMYTLGLGINT